MTAKRGFFNLIYLPPGEGGLMAIGGYNGNHIDVVGMAAAGTSSLTPVFSGWWRLLQAEDFGCRWLHNGRCQKLSRPCIYSTDRRRPWTMGHPKANVTTTPSYYRLGEQPLPRQQVHLPGMVINLMLTLQFRLIFNI